MEGRVAQGVSQGPSGVEKHQREGWLARNVRKSSSLHGLLKFGEGKKEIPPVPKQQCKPNAGFESPNGVRRMSVQEMRQTEKESTNVG